MAVYYRDWKAENADLLAEVIRQDVNPAVTTEDFIRLWPNRAGLPAGRAIRPDLGTPPHPDDTKNWLEDLIRTQSIRVPPKFNDVVAAILATFAVFTALALTNFLAPSNGPAIDITAIHGWRWWAFFTLVALLMRYIIGSALHLNYVYAGERPRSASVAMLFKDLMFLVLFGMLAYYIVEAGNAAHFIRRAMLFVLAGFAWSIFDYMTRRIWSYWTEPDRDDSPLLRAIDGFSLFVFIGLWAWAFSYVARHDLDGFLDIAVVIVIAGLIFCAVNRYVLGDRMPGREWPASFWRLWTVIDGAQFVLTWLALFLPGEMLALRLVTAGYVFFLFFDMWILIRRIQRDI
jgi:hypothetical protein